MAEIVGTVASVMTLAGAFSSCIHAFEAFYIAKEKKSELRTLYLQFKLQEARLWIWGKELGWVSASSNVDAVPLEDEVVGLIAGTLRHLFDVITDADALRSDYGCRLVEDPLAAGALIDDGREPAGRLTAVFEKFRVKLGVHPSVSKSILTWLIRDRRRFKRLVEVLRDTISDLKEVTDPLLPSRKQDEAAIRRLNFIDDVTTLEAVADVAEEDWPELSEAASQRSEKLSSASEHREIRHWIQATDNRNVEVTPTEDLESWTLSECKRQYMRLLLAQSKPPLEVPEPGSNFVVKETETKTNKKQYLNFEDAKKRTYRIPLDRCSAWKDMESLINHAFACNGTLKHAVESGHYDLLGPEKEIIMPQYWDSVIEPDMHITMIFRDDIPPPEDGILNLDDIPPPEDGILNLDDILNPSSSRKKLTSNSSTLGSNESSRSKIRRLENLGMWMLGSAPKSRLKR